MKSVFSAQENQVMKLIRQKHKENLNFIDKTGSFWYRNKTLYLYINLSFRMFTKELT